MQVTRSFIHDALGVSTPLDADMLALAVDQSVAEDERLDWKQALPDDGDEVAKDVAAMANTRGGLIVYGVAENKRGQAAKSMPVSLDERHQRRIRTWLATRIQPVVPGVEIVSLEIEPGSGTGYLGVVVPESNDTPHLVGKPESFRVPYRYGSQTLWMRERELERAYFGRVERRAADESRLAAIVDHLRDQVDLSQSCWLLGAAVPTVGAPGTQDPQTKDQAATVLQTALELGVDVAPVGQRRGSVVHELGDGARNPRIGLHRWIARNSGLDGPTSWVHAEVHHDGAVALAVRLNGWYNQPEPPKNYIPIQMVAGFCADLVALTAAKTRHLGLTGQTLVSIDLARPDDAPYALVTNEVGSGWVSKDFNQVGWSSEVRRFVSVSTGLLATNDLDDLRQLARDLFRDVVSQFGYEGVAPY